MPSSVVTIYQKPGSRGLAKDPTGFIKEFVIQSGDVTALAAAVEYDNCPAQYKDGYRLGSNFISANAILADNDNSHSDDPADWITHSDVAARMPGVEFYAYPSRSNMKPKDGKAPRPKTHYVIPTDHITDAGEYAAHMQWLVERLPELQFDAQVKSAAQLNFGVETPQVTHHAGSMNLSDFIKVYSNYTTPVAVTASTKATVSTDNIVETVKQKGSAKNYNVIPQGERNSHLSLFAARMLTKYGNDDGANGEAYRAFSEEAAKCSSPLPQSELTTIWISAVRFYEQTVLADPDYIPPIQYNAKPSVSELTVVDQRTFRALCVPPKEDRIFDIAVARMFLQAYGLSLRINEMNRRSDITGLPSKYDCEDAANILGILIKDAAANLGYKRATSENVYDALLVIANENRYHPVLELLNSEPWDGYDRRPEVYRMINLSDPFHMVLVHKWSLQTIAVLHNSTDNPIAAQGVLTLQGDQGLGKTEFFRHLAIRDAFFKEGAMLDMTNKDTLLSAIKVWLCELGELDSTTKKEQSSLKAFLTQLADHQREPYARNETVRPRRTAFCATVNPANFLKDTTGNRRFWTIPVNYVDLNAVFYYHPEWYAQYWRQILAEYRQNPLGYLLTRQEQDIVNGRNAEFEAEVYGEAEFMTLYDLEADLTRWTWKTAALISNSLNESFKSLNITSEAVGQRLLPRIEQRTKIVFQRKRPGGKRLILCPPIRMNWEQ